MRSILSLCLMTLAACGREGVELRSMSLADPAGAPTLVREAKDGASGGYDLFLPTRPTPLNGGVWLLEPANDRLVRFDSTLSRARTYAREGQGPGEIQFAPFTTRTGTSVTVAAQQAAFEQFIDRAPCLRQQRGRILERNSCREPWSHTTTASVRQRLPISRHALEVELDVINVLNLLNSAWGRYRVATPQLLEHVGQTAGLPDTAQPIFNFDPTRSEWRVLTTESAFQLQLGVRYRF